MHSINPTANPNPVYIFTKIVTSVLSSFYRCKVHPGRKWSNLNLIRVFRILFWMGGKVAFLDIPPSSISNLIEIQSVVSPFAWRNWRKFLRVFGVPDEIRTVHFRGASQKHFWLRPAYLVTDAWADTTSPVCFNFVGFVQRTRSNWRECRGLKQKSLNRKSARRWVWEDRVHSYAQCSRPQRICYFKVINVL